MTYTVCEGKKTRVFDHCFRAAIAFHLSASETRPFVIRTTISNGIESAKQVASTTLSSMDGVESFGKTVGGDEDFVRAYLSVMTMPRPELVTANLSWGCFYGWRCEQDDILAFGESAVEAVENWKSAWDGENAFQQEIAVSEMNRKRFKETGQCVLF
jgi:hypothetical protein